MKQCTIFKIVLPVIMLLSGCRNQQETGIWQVFELSVKNKTTYTNPFEDVNLNVTYIRPDGSIAKFPGFHAGQNTWKIRFMPDQTGRWKFSAEFSDKSKKFKGTFLCNESDLPGLVTLYEVNPVWFGYSSGKPLLLRSFHAGDRFFADTSNFITGDEWSDFHRNRFLDWLQENRYNMLSIASHYLNRDIDGRGKGWRTPDLWDAERQMPVPEEYDKLEKILNELSERKIIVFPFAGFLGRSSDFPADTVRQDTYIKYTLSRLSPYWNIVFNIGGPEPTLRNNPYLDYEKIAEAGKRIREADSFGHLLTVHCPTGDSEFKDEPWLDFVTMQGPKTTDRKKLYEGLMRNHPEGKGLYAQETLWPGNKYHPEYTSDEVRKNTIVAMMSAAMINFADMNGDSSSGFSGSLDPDMANDEIHKVFHTTLDFFESLEYYKMSPMNGITDNGFCLTLPGKEYLVYLEERGSLNLELEQGEYDVIWINAGDCNDIINSGKISDGQGLTSPDYGDDWFLRLIKNNIR